MALPLLDDLERMTREAVEAVDPTGYLLADHSWLRSVIDIYRGLAGLEAERVRVQADVSDLASALDLHIRREEEAYFPAIESVIEELGQGSTFDMYGEHDAIRIRLEELQTALAKGVGAGSAFAAFARSLLIHFENEEELIFAEAPGHLDLEARAAILARFEELAG